MKRLITSIVMLVCLVGFVGSSFASIYAWPQYLSTPDGHRSNRWIHAPGYTYLFPPYRSNDGVIIKVPGVILENSETIEM